MVQYPPGRPRHAPGPGGGVIELTHLIFMGGAIVALCAWMIHFFVKSIHAHPDGSLDFLLWESTAVEHGWQADCNATRQQLRGEVGGQPFSAEATITRRTVRTRYGTSVYLDVDGMIRVPIRGVVPVLDIVRPSFQNKVRLLLTGERPMATDVMDLDEAVLITGDDVDAVVPLLRRPAVRGALIALFREVPNVRVHDRGVELKLKSLLGSEKQLSRTIGLMTTAAAAFEGYVPSLDGSVRPVVLPEEAPLPARPRTEETEPVASSNAGPLYVALQKLGRAGLRDQNSAAQRIRIPPYRFEMHFRSVGEALTRTGMPNGNYRLNGVLTRTNWRVELEVSPEQADEALRLVLGDVVRGTCLVDEVVILRRAVAGSLTSPLELVESAPVRDRSPV